MPLRDRFVLIACVVLAADTTPAFGETGFTYQGRLTRAGGPVSGGFDLLFQVFDSASGGNLLGSQAMNDTAIREGLFTVMLNEAGQFGSHVFNGEQRWIQVTVNGVDLAPRQRITAAPYALALPGMRTPESGMIPSVVGGYSRNRAEVSAGTIAGGGAPGAAQQVLDDFGAIGGGSSNQAGSESADSPHATVGGGLLNVADGRGSTIGGGEGNRAGGTAATVAGGQGNVAGGDFSFAVGRAAHADHLGSFVWSDSRTAEVHTTDVNQFIIAAAGGVGIGTADPQQELHLKGDMRVDGRLYAYRHDNLIFGLTYSDQAAKLDIFNAGSNSPIVSLGERGGTGDGALVLRSMTTFQSTSVTQDRVETSNELGHRVSWLGTSNRHGHLFLYPENECCNPGVALRGGGAEGGGAMTAYGDLDSGTNLVSIQGEEIGAGGASGSVIVMTAESGAPVIKLDSGVAPGDGVFLFVDGDTQATGVKSAVVTMVDGARRRLYSTESPEVWIEDVGSGRLAKGRALVELDPLFLQAVTIDDVHPMRVLVTPTNACNGVYVQKGDAHFEVVELLQGGSDAGFDYRVIAKRRGYESRRLDRFATEP